MKAKRPGGRLKALTPWQDLQRRKKFRELLIKGMGQEKAAIEAGYSKHYARCQAHELAAKAFESLRDQAEIQGLDKQMLVRWLKVNIKAKEPKWNAFHKKWDHFENHTAQVNAWDRIRTIVEPKPPDELNINLRRGVDAPAAETTEQWVERIRQERLQQLERGNVLEATTGPTNGRSSS